VITKSSLFIILIFSITVSLVYPAFADGFSSIVDDSWLKISLSYPYEVKTGSCFTVIFQTTYLGSVTVSELRVKITYVSEVGSTTLLSDTLVAAPTSFTSGDVISKTYSICLPSTIRLDPSITGVVFANYTRDGAYRPLTHMWQMAVVRARTYNEVLNELTRAENQIRVLNAEIERLQSEITKLQSRLEEALRESSALSAKLEEARREYSSLEKNYESLSNEYKALNERYLDTVSELKSLQTLHQSLQEQFRALSENYRLLLHDYRNLTNEYTSLQASFNQLQTMYDVLTNRHESAKQQIGYLQSQLDEARALIQDLKLRYETLNNENNLHRSLAYLQAFTLVAVATGMASAIITRKVRGKSRETPPALPPPPPPSQ